MLSPPETLVADSFRQTFNNERVQSLVNHVMTQYVRLANSRRGTDWCKKVLLRNTLRGVKDAGCSCATASTDATELKTPAYLWILLANRGVTWKDVNGELLKFESGELADAKAKEAVEAEGEEATEKAIAEKRKEFERRRTAIMMDYMEYLEYKYYPDEDDHEYDGDDDDE